MDAYGAICRVAFYSSLALGAVNNVTVEFTSPFVTDPDGARATTLEKQIPLVDRRLRSLFLLSSA